jgi:hypothetical protein
LEELCEEEDQTQNKHQLEQGYQEAETSDAKEGKEEWTTSK